MLVRMWRAMVPVCTVEGTWCKHNIGVNTIVIMEKNGYFTDICEILNSIHTESVF